MELASHRRHGGIRFDTFKADLWELVQEPDRAAPATEPEHQAAPLRVSTGSMEPRQLVAGFHDGARPLRQRGVHAGGWRIQQ